MAATGDTGNSVDVSQTNTEKLEEQPKQAHPPEELPKEEAKEPESVEAPTEEIGEEPEKEEVEEEEEEVEVVEERTYLLPFQKVWRMPRQARAPKAARMLREYVQRHMKVEEVLLSDEVNQQIWAKGITNPPRKLRVRMVKDKEGKVTVYPAKGE